ncbi:MAG: insulinase family protein [Candidatus Aminicenantes bacterium]|nr:insulinase family protein [Candidatus Aminicenantes bacterium]
MSIHKKIRAVLIGCFVFSVIAGRGVYAGETNERKFYTAVSRGLEMKFIKDPNMTFIHAELLIFYTDKNVSPAIRRLTMLNIFDEAVNMSGSGLLSTLKRLGNDFTVVDRPDYLLFRINFLPDKLATFMQFLKGLYSYKAFALKKFNYSVYNYWKLFFAGADWQKQVAFQVAYQKLFPGQLLGNALIIPDQLLKINLAQIRSFYQNAYTLPNSLLIIKGNINNAVAVGSFNVTFKSFKKQPGHRNQGKEKLTINDSREVIIYHIESSNPPEIFWFETILPLSNKNHFPMQVLNDMLFGQPIGRLSRQAAETGIRFLKMETEIINHSDVSVICNAVRLDYSEIEKFILAVDNEKRKLKRIDRREYLDVKNYFCGRLEVDTRRVEYDVEIERDFLAFESDANEANASFSQISQQVTLESLNAVAPDPNRGAIVIVGNANLIGRYLTVLKPRIIRYIQ